MLPYDGTNQITGTLANGDPYYVRYVNPTTIRIYNTQNDALTGINTVGLSTDTAAVEFIFLEQKQKIQ